MLLRKTIALMICMLMMLVACASAVDITTPAPPQLADELIFYDWADDKIESVFDEFTEEYGVKITYLTFDATEEAVESMRAGQVYDIVVMENQFIPALIADGLLAEIDYQNVPNFKNISANFRDLAYDPQNRHAIPYSWGTVGLIVRTDLVEEPVTSWADMWDSRYAGRVGNWDTAPRYMLGMALKILGFSINSENPTELEDALALLLELKPNSIWMRDEMVATPMLASGDFVMIMGWSEDYWLAQEESDTVDYVLPEEGTILWGDNFVIPANSPNKQTAELLLNFLLRAEITGRIVNEIYYPMPNDAAVAFIDPEILNDSAVFPTNEEMKNAELLLPLSASGEQLYAEVWDRFLVDGP